MSYVDFQDHSENRNVVLSRAHSHEIVAPGPNPRHIKPIVRIMYPPTAATTLATPLT